MTHIATEGLNHADLYKLLVGSVVPRPIAWVTSMSATGVVNLAPFSAFTWVCHDPPLVGVAITRRRNGELKDTARNAVEHKSYVINIADEPLLEPLHLSSIEYDPEVSEAEVLGLDLSPSSLIDVPRLTDAPIALECRFVQALEFGPARQQFIIGEIISFYVRDDLYVRGGIDSAVLRPIARLAGPNYAHLGEIVRMQPVAEPRRA